MNSEQLERRICALISRKNGIKAREIAESLDLDRSTVNRVLFSSPLLKELCYQDRAYRWHGIIRQERPHTGLYEYSGYYGTVNEFLGLDENEWLECLTEGCQRIGRSLSDTRGLYHSFRDCRQQMTGLFSDLMSMLGESCLAWELAFEGFRWQDLQRWLLLSEYPFNIKTRQEFKRVGNFDYAKQDPRDAEVTGWSETVILERKFGTKHYLLPFKEKEVYLYSEFPQNPGW